MFKRMIYVLLFVWFMSLLGCGDTGSGSSNEDIVTNDITIDVHSHTDTSVTDTQTDTTSYDIEETKDLTETAETEDVSGDGEIYDDAVIDVEDVQDVESQDVPEDVVLGDTETRDSTGDVSEDGGCTDECSESICKNNLVMKACGDWDNDGCKEYKEVICNYGCENGSCNSCTPDCTGRECGDDGCGGSCGVCDDNNPCTDENCNAGHCVFTPNNNLCDDNNPCTVNDRCKNGQCLGSPKDCDDNNICTQDSCNSQSGMCVHTPLNSIPCDDGNKCTVNDSCTNGVCQGTFISCDDNNPCTDDTCDPMAGCVFIPNTKPCDDGNACTTGDKCMAGVCKGTPVVCDDGNPCTNDTCDPVRGCVFTPVDGNLCDDGNACTTGDKCVNGTCKGTPVSCNDNNPCTYDTCDPAQGCIHYLAPDGTVCDDGNVCTQNDVCINGTCQGGNLVDCNDNDICTYDFCDPSIGCYHIPVPNCQNP